MADPNYCPRVPDEGVRYHFNDDEYIVISANMDTLQMFSNPDYNHVRVYDPEDHNMKMLFIGAVAINELIDAGIPITPRDSITESEHEGWMEFTLKAEMRSLDEEIDELLDD